MTGPAIEVSRIGKRYGSVQAVEDASFDVAPGRITGLLGANGAGKSTTLRILLGLARPDTGRALIMGTSYRGLDNPSRTVGALLDVAGADRKSVV